jgi:hypothetical protein
MLASVLIIAASLVMLAYWFRYTCLLLLQQSPETANATAKSALGHLQLQDADPDPLQQALDRDYAVLAYLMRHAADLSLNPVERHLLSADYRFLRIWYRVIRSVSPAQAKKALEEMSSILCFLDRRIAAHVAGQA